MRSYCCIFCFFLIRLHQIVSLRKNYVNATVAVLLSLDGPLSYFPHLPEMLDLWKSHLTQKVSNDPHWPVNISVEFINAHGDTVVASELFLKRVHDSTLPPVSIWIGPEYTAGNHIVNISMPLNIPVVLIESIPVQYTSTSFFVIPETMYKMRAIIDLYLNTGVKSAFIIIMNEIVESYNVDTCGKTADLMASRGITVNRKVVPRNTTKDDYILILRQIRDKFNPDVIMICDWESCYPGYDARSRNPLYAFKQLNYLPKSLTMSDCMFVFHDPDFKDLFPYVISGTFSQIKCKGTDYTEDATPFSSYFRTKNAVNLTFTQDLNVGWIPQYPSSAYTFNMWYKQTFNTTPIDEDPALWACFDIVESALYRAASLPALTVDGVLDPDEVLGLLYMSDITTPLGRVAFNRFNTNTNAASVVGQCNPLTGQTELVGPSSQMTAQFIYPMPTWDERVYKWSLFKSPQTVNAIVVAAVCSFILLMIIVTVLVHHQDVEIRMLHSLHMASMCVAAIAVCWGLTFVWQADVSSWQCTWAQWTTFVPGSYMVQMANMKAYRLSCFVNTAVGVRPKPFPHSKVLKLVVLSTLVTAGILLISNLVDPLKYARVVNDQYRPSLDTHYCSTGALSTSLSYVLVVGHVVMSVLCVFDVRSGTEAFRDGTVMKEAFIVLYGFVLIAVIMNSLDLSDNTSYIVRTVCLSLGVTLFCVRMLVSRCAKFWLHKMVQVHLSMAYSRYLDPFAQIFARNKAAKFLTNPRQHKYVDDETKMDYPVYITHDPLDCSLNEMFKVFEDPDRSELLLHVAEEAHCVENVLFLNAVLEYREASQKFIHMQSVESSNRMKEIAKQIFDKHLAEASELEVNISSSCRSRVEDLWSQWADNIPIVSPKCASQALAEDSLMRVDIFSGAYKEVGIVTFQNIWNKFRELETQMHMTENRVKIESSSKKLPNFSVETDLKVETI